MIMINIIIYYHYYCSYCSIKILTLNAQLDKTWSNKTDKN